MFCCSASFFQRFPLALWKHNHHLVIMQAKTPSESRCHQISPPAIKPPPPVPLICAPRPFHSILFQVLYEKIKQESVEEPQKVSPSAMTLSDPMSACARRFCWWTGCSVPPSLPYVARGACAERLNACWHAEKLSGVGSAGPPFLSILSFPSFSPCHTRTGTQEEREKRQLRFLVLTKEIWNGSYAQFI